MNKIEQRKEQILAAKRSAEILTLREWYNTTNHGYELEEYFQYFTNLGRLGKELHKRKVKRVTELYEDEKGGFVEATFIRSELDISAPLCAIACVWAKLKLEKRVF
ncbi:hypothetical protein RJ730_12440 [Acinetobacter baumannii]|uniref:hypothetical protein n=1 Tax=Acinetobacter baumannii TaxID=470 RepID=UPI003896A2DC